MGTRKRPEAEYNDTLRKLGFGLENPPDDFSDQPGSSGRIGGVRGKQEYGIDGGVAGERDTEADEEAPSDPRLREAVESASETITDFSEEGERTEEESQEEEPEETTRKDPALEGDLKSLIEDRLQHNTYMDATSISVEVEASGLVILSGKARSDAESLRASEIAASLPGVLAIDNKIEVERL